MSALRWNMVAKGEGMTPGVHIMSMAQYQADPADAPSLSSGIAHRLITQSPLHAWHHHPRLNPNFTPEEKAVFDLGGCAHAVLLEGEQSIAAIDPNEYPGQKGGIPDGWTNKAIREARDAARAKGQIPVLAHKMVEIRAMADAARKAVSAVKGLVVTFSEGLTERTLIWCEGETWCRARPDWMSRHRSILLDYKSTAGSAEPNAWIRNQMGPLGYDMQAVHYLRGNEMTGGAKDAQWVFLVQENYPPFACSFVGLSPAMREVAQKKWDDAQMLWAHCIKTNQWPAYPRVIAYAEPTIWQLTEHEGRLLTSFDERLEYLTV
jgi:hypothetical protein